MSDIDSLTSSAKSSALAALEPDQLVAARKRPLPRRTLRPAESLMLWALRFYLVAVMGVLVYQVLTR